jgi:VanZ family protein
MITIFFIGVRMFAWILAFVIAALSVVPPWLRPETNAPHYFEHFAIFFSTGIAFGLGYSRKPIVISAALLLFAAMIEIAQIFVPARHARLSDFIVDGIAGVMGALLAALARYIFLRSDTLPLKDSSNSVQQ